MHAWPLARGARSDLAAGRWCFLRSCVSGVPRRVYLRLQQRRPGAGAGVGGGQREGTDGWWRWAGCGTRGGGRRREGEGRRGGGEGGRARSEGQGQGGQRGRQGGHQGDALASY
ncbi:hypothetical protein GQ55_4G056200 [Panicum hallii var. hallii]|uniref:Uncharacterized protein n=2 Tax=Panicum hallii TaxID=206008 RepID=A0A2T7DVL8_9POAL|nr:hypothetical protein GQ55_4G056200 [Panicum hallii var. hallii]PVH47404.1 hypothetical protein PAHAL_4G054000 [Panicum hallii]